MDELSLVPASGCDGLSVVRGIIKTRFRETRPYDRDSEGPAPANEGCLGKHTFEAGSGVRGMFDLHSRYRGAGSISPDPDRGYVTGPPSVL